jgi:SAM-dependent methyltransferase
MKFNTGHLTKPVRALGLMHVLDKIKFQYHKLKNRNRNLQFKLKYPEVILPPDYMLFESFKLDYETYFIDGRDSAIWLINFLKPHVHLADKKILDWGCGPARLTRHLPSLLPDCKIFGTDYNPVTIEWCRKNIPAVQFSTNNLNPPTLYENSFFDVIYGISIFTHLSLVNHQAWFEELVRILAPGGILLLTTHGTAFKEILTEKEIEDFDRGKLIIRDKAKEGHRVFTAFHPPDSMLSLFEKQCQILSHTPGTKKDWGIEQDTWILKKK